MITLKGAWLTYGFFKQTHREAVRMLSSSRPQKGLHAALMDYGINNKKQLLADIIHQNDDQSVSQTLERIRKMPTQNLLEKFNTSIIKLQRTQTPHNKKSGGSSKTATSFKRIFKQYCEILVKNSDELTSKQCLQLFDLIGQLQIEQGIQSITTNLSKRVLTQFKQADIEEKTLLMTEVFKSTNRPLQKSFLNQIAENEALYRECPPEFHFKLLSLWQKHLQSWTEWDLHEDEKKVFDNTSGYVNLALRDANFLEYLCTGSRQMKLSLIPLLSKFRGKDTAAASTCLEKLQTSLKRELTSCDEPVRQSNDLANLLYFAFKCEAILNQNLVDLAAQVVSQERQMVLLSARNLMRLSEVCLNSPQLQGRVPVDIIFKNQIERQSELPYSQKVSQGLLALNTSRFHKTYLEVLTESKFISQETAVKDLLDKIELSNMILDQCRSPEGQESLSNYLGENLAKGFLRSLYYSLMLPKTSLFFFRTRHLFLLLNVLSLDPDYAKERDFWLKTEDYILRMKKQLDLAQLAEVVTIYRRVQCSQIFWLEFEQLLLSLSAQFRGQPQLLYKIIIALSGRHNETFWKVFGGLVSQEECLSQMDLVQLIELLQIFDSNVGREMYSKFEMDYLDKEFKMDDNLSQVCKIATILIKFNSWNTDRDKMFKVMLKYFHHKATKNGSSEDLLLICKTLEPIIKHKELAALRNQIHVILNKSLRTEDIPTETMQALKIFKFEHFTKQENLRKQGSSPRRRGVSNKSRSKQGQ